MDKLVLTDVDGTILRHGAETASRRVAEAIGRMLAAGNVLVPVTSRTAKLMGRLATQLGLRHLGVLDGGATMFDFGQNAKDVPLSRWMTPEKTRAIMTAIEPYCDEIYYGEDSLLYAPEIDVNDGSPSVFALHPNTEVLSITRALSLIDNITVHSNRYESSTTHSCVQIVCEGVSKSSGVRALLTDTRYANFAPEDIVAIGDGDPDKDLLLAAPHGARRIAVGDNPRLRAVANAVVPPAEEDGFAAAMERYVLQ